jgi:hypothetical protein
LACSIAVRLPIDRCMVLPQMLHSTSPIRHCHSVGRWHMHH